MELLRFLAICLSIISLVQMFSGISVNKEFSINNDDSENKVVRVNKDLSENKDSGMDPDLSEGDQYDGNGLQDDMMFGKHDFGTFLTHHQNLHLKDNYPSKDTHVLTLSKSFQDSHPCLETSQGSVVVVDCSNHGLTYIDYNWFPDNTSKILFQGNQLVELKNGTFLKLARLRNVSFSQNSLRSIEAGAFAGLGSLESLNLEYNSLDIISAICKLGILNPLVSLKELFLMGNRVDLLGNRFPVGCLPRVDKLEALSVDAAGDSLYFGQEFRSAVRLSRLEISGTVKVITDNSFENVPRLKKLVLFGLEQITSISQDAFGPLKSLDSLKIDDVPLGLMNTLKLFRPLRNRSMSSIFIKMVEYTVSFDDGSLLMRDCFIDRNKTQYLTSICVKDFTLTNNQIFVMQEDALYSRVWESCLRSIDLSSNPLCGTREALLRILTFKNLQRISVADTLRVRSDKIPFWMEETDIVAAMPGVGNLFYKGETYAGDALMHSQVQDTLQQDEDASHAARQLSRFNSMPMVPTDNVKSLISSNVSSVLTDVGYFVHLPSSLRFVNFRRFIDSSSLNDTKATVIGGQNVQYFDLSDSGFREFNVVIRGFTGLKTFLLSGNDLSTLSVTLFDTFPSIQNLAISDCSLDSTFMSVNSGRFFQHLKKLQMLDLSSNLLSLLSPKTFAFNSDLTRLSLAENRFRDFPFDLKFTPNLRELRLQKNALTILDADVRDALDNLAARWDTFSLFLDGNILSCGCKSILFLQWLQSTRVMLDNGGNYTCMNNDGLLTDTKRYENLDALWRECWGEFFLSLSLVLLCGIVIGFLVVFVVDKKRTFIVSYLLQMFGDFKLSTALDYRIGVFIGYPDKDYQFPCHHLRPYIEDVLHLTTFVRDRDLLPSSDVGRGLSEAINSSWRVVLVFKEMCFRDDGWMLFTIRSAVYAQTPANPARVVVLVDEKNLREIPTELWGAVPEDNIVVLQDWALSYDLKETLRTRLL